MRHLFVGMVLLILCCVATSAKDQIDIVFLSSDALVAVHSNFRGQTVTLFGNIEPGPDAPQGPFSVVVLVQGPSADWVVREKERQGGLVLNSNAASYDHAPSYYAILSSRPLSQILTPEIVAGSGLSLSGLADLVRRDGDPSDLDEEFVRLMRAAGNFIESDRGVVLHSATTFSTRVPIASDAVNGLYLVRAFVIANNTIIGETTTRFTVRTQGFERYVANLARSSPALYGLVTVLIALGTGWLGGVLFKR